MIITLMNKTVTFDWLILLFFCMCNLKSVCSEEPVHSNFKGKYTADIKNYEIVVPQRVNKDGSFISHLVSHHHSKRSTKEVEFIFYKIPIEGEDYLIELTPNLNLISPGAVVEIHKDKTPINESSNSEKTGNFLRNLDIRKLENTECHFLGHVKGENISKAALSTCYGLAGFIQIMKGFYTIEPVAEHDPFLEDAYPHLLYKANELENSSICHATGLLKASFVDQVVRKRRESNLGLSLPLYIETLIVMDKALINHHQDSDCENYVLTVFNMAYNLFHDASSGLLMTLTIVKIIRLEVENEEMNLKVNSDAEKTLRYFQTWQYEINPGDDSHPNHHDIAILITRVDICYSPSTCGLLGLTTIGKACDPKLSAALCEDNGLRLGYIIAHEIGHLLGADHDSENSTCNGTDADGLKTIMHPSIPMTARTWSSCSQAYFKAFFSSGMGSCFLDEPEEHHYNIQDLLPGVMYGADFQCKHLFSKNAQECDIGSTCDSLNCYVPGYACIITHAPPADGTSCGENMWCLDTKCLVVGERPGAVDGNWGEWSAWGDCSRTCGSGVASSERNCDKPQPSHGGKNCVGERKRYKICAATNNFNGLCEKPVFGMDGSKNYLGIKNVCERFNSPPKYFRFDMISEEVNVSFVGKPCETGRPSFRDIQCGEFNDWIYPEDGQIHTWKAFFFHDDNPCILFCINEKKEVAALRPRVVDGTMCFRGIRDICVGGTCKSLPCDLHFESNAIEDACGVCHGDGTGCEFSEGLRTFTKLEKGFTKLVNVPAGTRNIKVEETSPTKANIIVRDADSKDTYVRGTSLGMFNVPGSLAWLGMVKKNQEALNIPGPITKPLSIWIQRLDNVTIKWSMGLPAEQQRKAEFAWDFLKWGPCSAICGPGTQISEPSCMEGKAGLVEDSFCADLEMPPAKVRQCEMAKCEPRWMVGDWRDCEPASQKKERKRVVYCIKPIGEGEGESQIVPDSECPVPKPHDKELCENRQKREDADFKVDRRLLETESRFKSDTSEFGFHKKYDDYLKHFAALPVPQRNCETIPLYLVSSPHFKHYFHVLETPEDSESSSGSGADKNLPGEWLYEAQTQKNVSPDFCKETFSGQQFGVSHIRSRSRGSSSMLENRKEKIKIQAPPQEVASYKNKDAIQRSNWSFKNIFNKSNSKLLKRRFSGRKDRDSPVKRSGNAKLNFGTWRKYKKNSSPTSPDLSMIGKDRMGELQTTKNSHWKSFNPKILNGRNRFSVTVESSGYTSKDISTNSFLRRENKKFRTRGPRRFPLTNLNSSRMFWKGLRNNHLQKRDRQKKNLVVMLESQSRKGFRRPSTAEEFFSRKKRNRYEHKQRKFKRKRAKSLHGQLHKKKRSSRKWKKPKSKDANVKPGKEQSGTNSGTETKNYLNTLFRDTHPTLSSKPPELKLKHDKLVIKEGLLVIDKDLPEDQEVDVLFDAEENGEKRKKYDNLPQPPPGENKLTLKGQDVFNLFQELQHPKREAPSLNSKSQENNEERNSCGKETAKPSETSTGGELVSPTTPTTQIQKPESTIGTTQQPHQNPATTPTNLKPNDTLSGFKAGELSKNDTHGTETTTTGFGIKENNPNNKSINNTINNNNNTINYNNNNNNNINNNNNNNINEQQQY